MPIVYRCKRCGYVFEVFLKVGQDSYGARTPGEIAALYGGRCPRCGARLDKPRIDDVIVARDPEGMLRILGEAEPSLEPALQRARLRLSLSRRRRARKRSGKQR